MVKTSEDTRTLKSLILEECKTFAESQAGWKWHVKYQAFYKSVFENTSIWVSPEWKFSGYRVYSQPVVFFENTFFDKATNICDIKILPWKYQLSRYFNKYTIGIAIYNDKNDFKPQESSFYKDKVPEIIDQIFSCGKKLFEEKFDFLSEEKFLACAVERDEDLLYNIKHLRHMLQLTPEAQAILRLMLFGDEDYAKNVMVRYDKHGGDHFDNMPKILPHLDAIKFLSPYLGKC